MQHELRTWPAFYQEVVDGQKPFEVRWNDRNFKVGDTLLLKEWDPGPISNPVGYTGRQSLVRVTYVLTGQAWGVMDGFCVMGIEREATYA